MANIKVSVEGQDRKTLIRLIKAERNNAEVKSNSPVTTQAQRRAVEFYEDHLRKLQKRLDPNEYPYK